MLKTHQNGPERDNLLSYAASDPLLKRMLTDQPDDNDADDQNAREMARLKASPEFKQMKSKMKVRRDGVSYPASDEYILDQLMRRRAAKQMREQREQQQVEGE